MSSFKFFVSSTRGSGVLTFCYTLGLYRGVGFGVVKSFMYFFSISSSLFNFTMNEVDYKFINSAIAIYSGVNRANALPIKEFTGPIASSNYLSVTPKYPLF